MGQPLPNVVTWIEKDRYTLIEQSVHQVLLTFGSLAIAVNDICIQFRYICV